MTSTGTDNASDRLRQLVRALARRVDGARVVETHISVLLLGADRAWKFKKPVDLGFVDFSTAGRRRHYCEEELRLNRRLTPELYLDLVAFGGDPDDPRPDAEPTLEWAVLMRRFPDEDQLDRRLAARGVPGEAFAALGRDVAAFHAGAAVAAAGSGFGSPGRVAADCMDNFDALGGSGRLDAARGRLDALREWTERELARLGPVLERRLETGRVRECHGDMHLSNMVWLDGRIRLFDCIEFSEPLRWIDVSNEVAFVLMDLDERGRSDLGRTFLDAWLQAGGDFDALLPLTLFRAYRSMVRAKVAALRAGQAGEAEERETAVERALRHVQLAERYAGDRPRPVLILTRGLSGSGKTTVTGALLPVSDDAVRVRSDVERKRLHGMEAGARTHSAPGEGLYTPEADRQTYQRLLALARTSLGAGHHTVVDATFLERSWRDRFAALARSLGCRHVLLDCVAPAEVLRERVRRRESAGTDASEAGPDVLERQLARTAPPQDDEQAYTVTVDTREAVDARALAARLGIGEPADREPSAQDRTGSRAHPPA